MQPTQPIFHPQKMRFKLTPRWNSSWLGNPHFTFRLCRIFFPLLLLENFHGCFRSRKLMYPVGEKTHVPRRCAQKLQKLHLVNAPERSVNDNVAPRWWRHVAGCRSERFWLLSSHSEKTSSFKLIKQGWGVHRKVPHILKPRLCINEIQQRSISFLQMVLRKTK